MGKGDDIITLNNETYLNTNTYNNIQNDTNTTKAIFEEVLNKIKELGFTDTIQQGFLLQQLKETFSSDTDTDTVTPQFFMNNVFNKLSAQGQIGGNSTSSIGGGGGFLSTQGQNEGNSTTSVGDTGGDINEQGGKYVIFTATNGIVSNVTGSSVELFGISPDEADGLLITDFLTEESMAEVVNNHVDRIDGKIEDTAAYNVTLRKCVSDCEDSAIFFGRLHTVRLDENTTANVIDIDGIDYTNAINNYIKSIKKLENQENLMSFSNTNDFLSILNALTEMQVTELLNTAVKAKEIKPYYCVSSNGIIVTQKSNTLNTGVPLALQVKKENVKQVIKVEEGIEVLQFRKYTNDWIYNTSQVDGNFSVSTITEIEDPIAVQKKRHHCCGCKNKI